MEPRRALLSEKKEFFDPPDVLEQKVDQLAQWVRESSHCIAFTGAGVSTAAGIPDFRSGMNTSLSTGPGVWELRDHGAVRSHQHRVTSVLKAIPTATHMAFVKLEQEGILKCVISQNTDGLHRRSGLPKSALCELHGNSNLEVCTKCGREYLRDFETQGLRLHLTGRNCDDPACRGPLKDTIINFGESLPEGELKKSYEEADVADLCISMGSSLSVIPAAGIPVRVAKRKKQFVIVNLQATLLDDLASLRINAKCDDVIKLLMGKLKLDIPEFRLRRCVVLKCSTATGKKSMLAVEGRDMEGHPFSFIKEAKVVSVEGKESHQAEPVTGGEGLAFTLPWSDTGKEKVLVKLRVHFHAHYGEPPLSCEITAHKSKAVEEVLHVEYNPFMGEWSVEGERDRLASQLAATALS